MDKFYLLMFRVNIPSFLMKPGDTFQWSPLKRNSTLVNSLTEVLRTKTTTLNEQRSQGVQILLPQHIKCDLKELKGEIKQVVQRPDVSCAVNEQLIIEFYSRKI